MERECLVHPRNKCVQIRNEKKRSRECKKERSRESKKEKVKSVIH